MIQFRAMILDYACKRSRLKWTWTARLKIAGLLALAVFTFLASLNSLNQWWEQLSAIKNETMSGFVWDAPAPAFSDGARRRMLMTAASFFACTVFCAIQAIRIRNAPESKT